VKVSVTPTGTNSLSVTIQAGAGLVRRLDLNEVRNLSADVGTQHGVTAPISYTPLAAASSLNFSVTQVAVGTATYAALTVTDDCGPWQTFVGSGPNGFQRGGVTGIVRDAATARPIVGATVAVPDAQKSTTTDTAGSFSLSDLVAGQQTLSVSATGYTSQTQQVTVVANQMVNVAYALDSTQTTDDITISVTWDAFPSDLDAHLSGPGTTALRFHLYWDARQAASYASLVGDARTGFGPESVVIRPNPSTNRWVAGAYRFWVHNFSGSPGFRTSAGVVKVTRGGKELGSYSVADAEGTSTMPLWQVVTVTVDANGQATLTPVQQFLNGNAGTVLRFQDGTDGSIEWPGSGKP